MHPAAFNSSRKNSLCVCIQVTARATYPCSLIAATPALWANTERFHSGSCNLIFSARVCSQTRYPSRTPGIAYSLVNARTTTKFGNSSDWLKKECVISFPVSSIKHSSSTSVMSYCLHFSAILKISSGSTRFPTGLFGFARNTREMLSSSASRIRSVRQNFSSFFIS